MNPAMHSSICAAVLAAGFLAQAGAAQAATTKQCQNYANEAVGQFMQMQKFVACKVKVSKRWQPNYNAHFSWCKGAQYSSVKVESQIRNNHLVKCGAVVEMAEPGMNPVD